MPVGILLLGGVYYCAAKLALLLASVHPSAAPVWPPTGIALAALLIFGCRVWPGIFLGAFLANITTFGSMATSLGIASGNTLEGLIGAYLVNQLAGGRRAFERPQDVFKFSVLAGVVATTISATFGVSSLSFGGLADWSNYWAIWITWWLGDMSGALVVAPFIILWTDSGWNHWNRKKFIEAAALLITLFLAVSKVFNNWFGLADHRYPLAIHSLPILAWAAMRFGVRVTAAASLLLSGVAVWGTLRGSGPFASEQLNESLLLLQLFVSVSTVTSLMLAAAVSEQKRVKEALQGSESQLRAVLHTVGEGIVTIDTTGTIVMVNPEAGHIWGYRQEELVGKSAQILMPEKHRESHAAGLKRYLETGMAQVLGKRLEMEGTRKDGSVFPLEISIKETLIGERLHFTAAVRDIAERKRTEKELLASEEWFRALIENSSDAVALISPEGAIKYASPSTQRILGYSSEEFVGRNAFEFIHPDDLGHTKRHLVELLKNPNELVRAEYRVQHKNGHWLWMEGVGHNLLGESSVGAVVINYRDITERKAAEKAGSQLAAIVESSDDAIVGKDLEGIIRNWNWGAERLYGFTAAEAVGQSVALLVPPHLSGDFSKMMAKIRQGERVEHYETERRTKDGRLIDVSLSISPVFDSSGRVVGAASIARNISEQKRLERELQQANEKLSGWVQELEQRNREVFVLNEMGDLLQTCLNFDEAYQVIARSAPNLFLQEPGGLFIFEPHGRFLAAAALWGEPLLGERSFEPDDCWALRRGRMHLVEKPQSELVCPHLTHPLWKGCLCVPLVAQSETLGLLHLQSGPKPEPAKGNSNPYWSENKVRLVRTVAEHIALNLANLKLRATLSERSIRDPLTGLFNRRYLEESLERELYRAAREHRPLGTIMIDLDGFKKFNDTFGHSAGDQVLRALGDFLQKKTRGGDIACRYGGEEFTLILPGTSLEVARQRAEQLRQEIQHLKVPYSKHLTVSLGVAVFPEHGTTKEALLKAADFALYQAKSEGGNRVAVAQSAGAGQTKVR